MRVVSGVAPRTWLYALVALTLVFKVWLSAVFPITGDEAYFIDWGLRPAPGYYDHPPMVGWWLAVLTQLSQAPWVLRLPATLMPALMALALYGLFRRNDEDKAALAAIGLLLVPIHVWNVFITTDTPLVFFSFLSGLAYWRASRPGASHAWHVAAGIFLGLACLSKYFAALLGLSFLVHALLAGERRHRIGFLMACVSALPFVGFNLYWNYGNCWANFMFNLYNRHGGAGLSWRNPLLFVAMLLYVLPIPALLGGLRARAWRVQGLDAQTLLLLVLAIFPWLMFAGLSTVRQVGLHWVLSFVPFFFAAGAMLLERQTLRRTAMLAGAFSLVHVILIAVAAAMPMERWQGNRLYDGIVFHFRIDDVLKVLASHEAQFEIAADGYSAAATLSYYRGSPVFVFGEASSHARHDDLMTDFRSLQGKNIAVLRKTPPAEADYQPYFASVEYQSFTLAGAQFHLVLGRQFDYPAYRDRILAQARDRYYRIPSYLPQGGCSFCERYFSAYCPLR